MPVSVAVSPLPATTRGGTLESTVTVTNMSPYDKPLNLAALCPDYTERLFPPNGGTVIETHLALNCQPAGWLAAKESVTFAMRLRVPTDSSIGTATLVWQLGARGPGAKATFLVTP